jgi:hypothetical protein
MKDFVTYEPALALKELGFDEPCLGNYFHTKELKIYGGDILRIKNSDMGTVTAPTFSQAFRWFREKYQLLHSITEYNKDGSLIIKIYQNKIVVLENMINFDITEYEEAELACLNKLIEIVKTKQL